MPADRRQTTRLAIIGGAIVAAIIIVIVIVAASGGDDDDAATTSTSELVIQSPATVTGITGVTGGVPDTGASVSAPPLPSSAPTASGGDDTTGDTTYALVRTLATSGTVDCATPGSWQPFEEVLLTFPVGQPAANATCGDTVLDLPPGFCSSDAPCTEVPDDWYVVEQPDVSPQALMMIVAPTDETSNTGQLLCVRDFVPQPKQILPVATPIEVACLSSTSDSVEIPYVPPATSDIPYVPPPVSVDLPPATS